MVALGYLLESGAMGYTASEVGGSQFGRMFY